MLNYTKHNKTFKKKNFIHSVFYIFVYNKKETIWTIYKQLKFIKHMKKKILITIMLFALVTAWNYYLAQDKIVLSDLTLENIDALAGCESRVKFGAGRETNLNCTNSSGESYTLKACDFDMGYSTECEGRPVN